MADDDDVDTSDTGAPSDDADDWTASTDEWDDSLGNDDGDDDDDATDDWDVDVVDSWDAGTADDADAAPIEGAAAASNGDGDSFLMGSSGSGMQNALAGFDDPAASADPQRARVVGWYAVCMFVADGGRRCGYSEYSMDENGAQAKKNSHAAANPTHANAIVVQQSS